MNNKIKIIREKLSFCDKILYKAFLQKLLDKFAPNYKIKDLTTLKLISSIKRWKYYLNNLNRELENPYKIAKAYFEWKKYMFWGIWVYNKYSFSTQIPEWYTVYNTQISTEKIIWKTKFIFIKQRENFFYGNIVNKDWDEKYNIMSRERAFIQMLKEKKEFENLPKWIDKQKLLKLAKNNTSKNIISKIEKLCI